jgi:PAS domain S-box-containing protein
VKQLDVAQIETLCEVAWIKDSNGRFLAVNRAFASEFHVDRRDVVGKSDFYIFSVQLAKRMLDNDFEVMRAGRPLRIEDCYVHDGASKLVEALKTPIVDASGKVLGTLTIMRELAGRTH